MMGVTLSRWTMAYFAAAILFLMAAEILMAAGFGFPRAAILAPETLILVHIVAIGWLSLLICGALFQFVPVLVAQPIYSNMLPFPALILLISGLSTLVTGFLQLAGRVEPGPPFFLFAGVLLGTGFGLVVLNLARTILAAQTHPLPTRFVIVGLFSVAVAVIFGITFALAFGGAAIPEPLATLASTGLPIHVIAGLGGWLTFTAMGVSYRLLAMFMLAPELERRSTKIALWLGAAALAIAIGGGALAVLLHATLVPVLLAAGGSGSAALILYGADMLHLYRERKRRNIELNSRMTVPALGSLAASLFLIIGLLAVGQLMSHIGAVIFLVGFGWLSGLGLAQLYKIVAFLTWIECYGPVLGRMPTPRVEDLVVEPRLAKWFLLYFLAVWTGALTLMAGYFTTFQACAATMFLATAGIVTQLVRTRRLVEVSAALRLPEGACKPRLLYSPSHDI